MKSVPSNLSSLFVRGLVGVWLCASSVFAQSQLQDLEQQTLYAAAKEVSKFVVRIETIGGAERVGAQLVSSAPTTGVIVGEDGYIVSSAYAFVKKPNSILVELPNGKRQAAKIVSRDNRFRLVLLKVEVDEPLEVPTEIGSDVAVGQWAVTVARTFPGDGFNMSVGIVSATDRVWGRAIQIDANVSPANYGGALADIDGQILGVLVPLSPDSNQAVAGTEWYDSGIGFAVPLGKVMERLDELKEGDLNPGLMGISMKSANMYGSAATIGVSRPKSPARDADLRKDDVVIEANGQPITQYAQLKHVLGPMAAGDVLSLTIRRGDEELEKTLELTDKLEAYEHAFLGILPAEIVPASEVEEAEAEPEESDDEEDGDSEPIVGVAVRYVFDESPAGKAGLQANDVITKLGDDETRDEATLRELLAGYEPGKEVEVTFLRDGESKTKTVKLVGDVVVVPDEMPDRFGPATDNEDLPPLGKIDIKLPEEVNDCVAYIPQAYDPKYDHALLVLLPAPGEKKISSLVRKWRDICDETRTILLLPQANDSRSWVPTEKEFIRKTIENLRKDYAIDRDRIVIGGESNSGSMAMLCAFSFRDLIRGVATHHSGIPRGAPQIFNEPLQRLSFWMTYPKEGRQVARIERSIELIRKLKFSVVDAENEAEGFDDESRLVLLRWLDTLDRI